MITAVKPKVGDRRPLPPCPMCGGEQYEEYVAISCYHNSTRYEWKRREHYDYCNKSYGACISHLRDLISDLTARLNA